MCKDDAHEQLKRVVARMAWTLSRDRTGMGQLEAEFTLACWRVALADFESLFGTLVQYVRCHLGSLFKRPPRSSDAGRPRTLDPSDTALQTAPIGALPRRPSAVYRQCIESEHKSRGFARRGKAALV